MTSPGHSSDEDFLGSLGISLDTDLTADADTHASVTGIYAQVSLLFSRKSVSFFYFFFSKMNPFYNHNMHNWTKSLSKVEKINLGRYGLSPIATLRGVVID